MPDFVHPRGCACLRHKPVGEGLLVVGPVPEERGLVAEADAGTVEQRGVGVADGVPAHARTMEVSHRVDEGFAGAAVVATHREGKLPGDELGAWAEWHRSHSRAGLGRVTPSVLVPRAAHPEDAPLDVVGLDCDDLAPSQAGEQHELCDATPDPGHPVDDRFYVGEFEVMRSGSGRWYARTVGGEWQRLDDPAPLGVAQGPGEGGVDALDGCRCLTGCEEVCDECQKVLGADLPDERGAEVDADVLRPAPVAGDGVRPRAGLPLLGGEPGVQCCGEGLLCDDFMAGKCPLGSDEIVARSRVRVLAADLPADEPLAAALIPFGALVPASLDDGGDR